MKNETWMENVLLYGPPNRERSKPVTEEQKEKRRRMLAIDERQRRKQHAEDIDLGWVDDEL